MTKLSRPSFNWKEWLCESLFGTPTETDSPGDTDSVKSEDFTPLGQAAPFATKHKNHVVASVTHLLLACCPSAVVGLVVAVPIRKTVDGMLSRWRTSHVCQEYGEIVPCLADFNANATVTVIGMRFGIEASLPHHLPNRILSCRAVTVSAAFAVLSWFHTFIVAN